MYNFPLIARIHGLQRELSVPPSPKNLYDGEDLLLDEFLSTWTVGAQVLYNSNSTLWNVSGDFHSTDEYVYRLVDGVITKVGRSLFNTSFGYATQVHTDCELTNQTYIFYSQTYSKWRPDRWDEDADWFDGVFLQNSNEVTYVNGEVTSSVRYCPYRYDAYSSCSTAYAQGAPDYSVYCYPEAPINVWNTETYLYGNFALSTTMSPTSFYVNISGVPTHISIIDWAIENIAPCTLPSSFGYYETPYKALNPGSYSIFGYLWSQDTILQVSSYVYTTVTLESPAGDGFYYTVNEVIEVYNGSISAIYPAFTYYQGHENCSQTTSINVYAFSLDVGRTLYTWIDAASSGSWNALTGYLEFSYSGTLYELNTSTGEITGSYACST